MARIKNPGHFSVCHWSLEGLVKILLNPINTTTEADREEVGLRLSAHGNKAFLIHGLPEQPLAPENLIHGLAQTSLSEKTPLMEDWLV